MIALLQIRQNSVSFIEVSSVETLSDSLIILGVFVAFDNRHFDQWLFVAVTVADHTKVLTDFLGQFSVVTCIHTIIWIIIKILSSGIWRFGSVSAIRRTSILFTHFEFSEVSLNVFGYNSIENIFRNVLQRLAQCSSHLVSNLSFQETVKLLALWNNTYEK